MGLHTSPHLVVAATPALACILPAGRQERPEKIRSFFSLLLLKNNLFRVVFRITGDVEKSEQNVQEALLKVWEDRDSWIVIENLPSYCMMVARNLALRETYSGNKERMERYAVR